MFMVLIKILEVTVIAILVWKIGSWLLKKLTQMEVEIHNNIVITDSDTDDNIVTVGYKKIYDQEAEHQKFIYNANNSEVHMFFVGPKDAGKISADTFAGNDIGKVMLKLLSNIKKLKYNNSKLLKYIGPENPHIVYDESFIIRFVYRNVWGQRVNLILIQDVTK